MNPTSSIRTSGRTHDERAAIQRRWVMLVSVCVAGMLGLAMQAGCSDQSNAGSASTGGGQGAQGATTASSTTSSTTDAGGSAPGGMGGAGGTRATGGMSQGGMGGTGASGQGGMGGAGGTSIGMCTEALLPLESPSDIVITELAVGSYFELHNPSNMAIDLSVAQQYAVCASMGSTFCTFLSALTGAIIPPGGYRTVPWPSMIPWINDGAGELQLRNSSMPNATLDYVCWGDPASFNSSLIYGAVNDGDWTGACAGSILNGALKRLPNNTGDTGADWDATAIPDPTNCD